MNSPTTAPACYHCGTSCETECLPHQEKNFCCEGCRSVYLILQENGLENFYQLANAPGQGARRRRNRFDYDGLESPELREHFLRYSGPSTEKALLKLPDIHCSSCVYLLENLGRLNPDVLEVRTHFARREAEITYRKRLGLKAVALLLDRIGYPPSLSIAASSAGSGAQVSRKSWYQLGVAGFCAGNIMLMSFPEYFSWETLASRYHQAFAFLNMLLALPVVFYSGKDYFQTAFKSLRSGQVHMEVPLALGMGAMFLLSLFQVLSGSGPGYWDSLAGLVFFLLVGKVLQEYTYSHLTFQRDYTSYFPLAVQKLVAGGRSETCPVKDLQEGDRIRIRHRELLPADARLLSAEAQLDYSFVTGEAQPVPCQQHQKLYAGAINQGSTLEAEVLKPVSQSYLTGLWDHPAFRKAKFRDTRLVSPSLSKWFTLAVLGIAAVAGLYWGLHRPENALFVSVSVLIVACPCALSLSPSFLYSTAMALLGRQRIFLKNAAVLQGLARIRRLIFDKTGTLSTGRKSQAQWHGTPLSPEEKAASRAAAALSTHPLSQAVAAALQTADPAEALLFEERPGAGLKAHCQGREISLGAAQWCGAPAEVAERLGQQTAVHLAIDGQWLGYFLVWQSYRPGLGKLVERLQKQGLKLSLFSGDSNAEAPALQTLLGPAAELRFRMKPEEKLRGIERYQQKREQVLMVGDGLNDAGALQQADIGMAISEEAHAFTPASDIIVEGRSFALIGALLRYSRALKGVFWVTFAVSLLYNLAGLAWAVSGHLEPVVAAVLMPLSSLTAVGLGSGLSWWAGKKLLGKHNN